MHKKIDFIPLLCSNNIQDVKLAVGLIEAEGLDISDIFTEHKEVLEKHWFRSTLKTFYLKPIFETKTIGTNNSIHHYGIYVDENCASSYNNLDQVWEMTNVGKNGTIN